ncbi:MAG: hypothetical protein ACREOJ_07575 [Gemmatimonadaceae bacterium]
MPAPLEGDRKAGLIGLAVGAVFVLVVIYSVVHITNRHYAKLEAAKPAAQATQ